jgi:membrane protein
MPGASTLLNLLPLLCSMAAFTLIYATVPNTRVPFRHALIGGLFTATLFEAAKQLFGVYVGLFPSYQLIYGAFAAVPLFLLWIYLSWLIVLFGAELVCCLSFPRHSRLRRLPRVLALLGVLRVLLERQQQGQGASIADLEAAGWPLADDEWLELIGFLEGEKLICPIGGDQWLLCRDLNHYSLTCLLQRSPWPLPTPQNLPESLDEPWYPAVRSALTLLHEDHAALFSGALAQWLQPEAEPLPAV